MCCLENINHPLTKPMAHKKSVQSRSGWRKWTSKMANPASNSVVDGSNFVPQ